MPTSRPIARNELRCPSVNLRPKTSLQVVADNWLIIAIKRVLLKEWISASAQRVNDSYCVSLRHSVGQVRSVPILSSSGNAKYRYIEYDSLLTSWWRI